MGPPGSGKATLMQCMAAVAAMRGDAGAVSAKFRGDPALLAPGVLAAALRSIRAVRLEILQAITT